MTAVKPYCLIFILCIFGLATKSQTTLAAEKNYGCDYFPIYNPTATKVFGEDTYYGVKGSEKSNTYYSCKNGTVTQKIITSERYLAESLWEWRNDINDYGWVNYYDTRNKVHTKVVFKFNQPDGVEWSIPYSDEYMESCKIESKTLSMEVNGKQYKNILKLSYIIKKKMTKDQYVLHQDDYNEQQKKHTYENTFYCNGEVYSSSKYFYFDKKDGLIKQEDSWNELKANCNGRIDWTKSERKIQYEKQEKQAEDKMQLALTENPKSAYFNELLKSTWVTKDRDGVINHTIDFDEKGAMTEFMYVAGYSSMKKFTHDYFINGDTIEIKRYTPTWEPSFKIVKTDKGKIELHYIYFKSSVTIYKQNRKIYRNSY